MGDDLVTDASLRQFLLGQLNEEERQQVERIFITDSQARERILLVEQDLIEDYLDESLTAAERNQFLQQFAATPAQRRKLRITKAIKDRAVKERRLRTGPVTASVWSRLGELLRPRRLVLVVPITAAILVAIVTAVIWVNRRVERQTRRTTIAREIIQLNAPSNRQVTPETIILELRSGASRGVDSPPQVVKKLWQVVELRLLWPQSKQYSSYRAVVQRVGDDESIPVDGLRAEDDGTTIRLKLPTAVLSRGTYRVEITGISADGANSRSEEYQFTVSD
jgi:anti-sigma factor RsiW